MSTIETNGASPRIIRLDSLEGFSGRKPPRVDPSLHEIPLRPQKRMWELAAQDGGVAKSSLIAFQGRFSRLLKSMREGSSAKHGKIGK